MNEDEEGLPATAVALINDYYQPLGIAKEYFFRKSSTDATATSRQSYFG
jgi:hypothetical protein